MIFLHVFSCYSGGINSTQLHTLEQLIPCPILVESSVDIPAFSSSEGYGKLFAKTEELLFKKNKNNVRMPKILQHLSQADLFEIAKQTPLHLAKNLNNYLNSLAMTLLPTNVADVPKISYTLPTLDLVFDINSQLKNKRQKGDSARTINVPPQHSTLLFSSSVVDSKIIINGSKLLLAARGGSSQHLVRELEAPNIDIQQIAKATFESTMGFPSPAKKSYYFGTITCQYNGKLTVLENCMLKKNRSGMCFVI